MRGIILALVTDLALWPALPGFMATAYTSRTAYDAATAGYVQKTITNFDSQAAGTPAQDYGNLHIAANGLASDGLSGVTLSPIATNIYSTASSPNALAAQSDNQFLAGNGDTITFSFSSPLYAFGVYLVGNPSPTGDPAIPFWKMHADVGGGFDALSATNPIVTLSSGNDEYFLGIVSTDTPFSQVTLYSDNDPAACFSFNADDLIYAILPDEVTLGQAKSLGSGDIRVTAVVTRVHSDRFNIETPDRTFGMAIIGTGATRGKAVTLTGAVSLTPDEERVINLYGIISQFDWAAPGPFSMNSRSVGGGVPFGAQIGVPGSLGPNNIGLDATIWGTITQIAGDSTWMTVDDGGGRASGMGSTGVKVVGAIDAGGRRVGDFVVVGGSVSLYGVGLFDHYPLIRVAQRLDISPYRYTCDFESGPVGWLPVPPGTLMQMSNAAYHSPTRSALARATMAPAMHRTPERIYPDGVYLSCWIRDIGGSGALGRHYITLQALEGGNVLDSFSAGIYSTKSTMSYCVKTTSQGWWAAGVPRTNGWHQFAIEVRPYTGSEDVWFYVDGTLVAKGNRLASYPINDIQLGTGGGVTGQIDGYYDDVEFGMVGLRE